MLNYMLCLFKVFTLKSSGEVIAQTKMTDPAYFGTISNDDSQSLSLADYSTGVYQSTDGGLTWQLVFRAPRPWATRQAIRVTATRNTTTGDIITTATWWTIDVLGSNSSRLSLYDAGTLERRDVSLPSHITSIFQSRLAYDDKSQRIFMTDVVNNDVHQLSVDGSYIGRLLSGLNAPCSIVVNTERALLYVGQSDATVGVYKLA
jgi:hypothetical protein